MLDSGNTGSVRRARRRTLMVAALAALMLGAMSARALADTTAATGDESVAVPTSWSSYTGLTTSQVTAKLGSSYRLVDVRQAADGTYTVTMVPNSGAYVVSAWWWYVHKTQADVSSLLTTNSARLISAQRNSDNTYNVIMVSESGTDNLAWKWYFGTSATNIVNAALGTGYRVFKLVPFTSGGTTTYAGLMIDNLSAENRRVENLLESGYGQDGLSSGVYGFYVKPIGSTSASLNFRSTTKYEPASGIKALYNLYAEFQVQIGDDSLSSPFNYWYDPSDPTNKDVCPLSYADTSSNETTTTLQNGLNQMMGVSDNRATQGVDLRYGRTNVNAYAQIIGLASTRINQTVGCGTLNGGYVTTSLTDLSKLYEGVWTNTLLNSTREASFFGRMNGGSLSGGDPLATVINQEAAAAGKSSVAAQFIADVSARDKGGSYDVCAPSGPCSPPYIYDRSDAGVLTLPFKSGGTVVPHTYTYGWWVNNLSVPCAFGATCAALTQADATTSEIRAEAFRAQVRAALKTW